MLTFRNRSSRAGAHTHTHTHTHTHRDTPTHPCRLLHMLITADCSRSGMRCWTVIRMSAHMLITALRLQPQQNNFPALLLLLFITRALFIRELFSHSMYLVFLLAAHLKYVKCYFFWRNPYLNRGTQKSLCNQRKLEAFKLYLDPGFQLWATSLFAVQLATCLYFQSHFDRSHF